MNTLIICASAVFSSDSFGQQKRTQPSAVRGEIRKGPRTAPKQPSAAISADRIAQPAPENSLITAMNESSCPCPPVSPPEANIDIPSSREEPEQPRAAELGPAERPAPARTDSIRMTGQQVSNPPLCSAPQAQVESEREVPMELIQPQVSIRARHAQCSAAQRLPCSRFGTESHESKATDSEEHHARLCTIPDVCEPSGVDPEDAQAPTDAPRGVYNAVDKATAQPGATNEVFHRSGAAGCSFPSNGQEQDTTDDGKGFSGMQACAQQNRSHRVGVGVSQTTVQGASSSIGRSARTGSSEGVSRRQTQMMLGNYGGASAHATVLRAPPPAVGELPRLHQCDSLRGTVLCEDFVHRGDK